jgi:GNAT superfamily N-acetyltransferase
MAEVTLRRAIVEDAPILARHRAEMFLEMGRIPPENYSQLLAASQEYFEGALAEDNYVGFLCESDGDVVAGGGVQPRLILPRYTPDGRILGTNRQGLVMNVFTEIGFRKRGLAEQIMLAIVDWAKAERIPFLVLHASDAGQPLYERLGFSPTNELGLFVDSFEAREPDLTSP